MGIINQNGIYNSAPGLVSLPRRLAACWGIMPGMMALSRWFWYLLPANPVAVRIVQGGSRRGPHLAVRMGYLGAIILLLLIGLIWAGGLGGTSVTELAKASTWVFAIISYGQVALVCLIAPLFLAGTISQELSGPTCDILLTTPLSNLQIVLGALLGRLFFVLALLASGLPLFAVLLLFGGVPVAAVFVSFAVAGLVALTVGAVAVALAVLRLDSPTSGGASGGRKAVYGFIIGIAAYLLVGYAADQLLRNRAGAAPSLGGARATTWLTPGHPFLVLESYLNTANYRPAAPEDLADRPLLARYLLGQPLASFAALSAVASGTLIFWTALRLRRTTYNQGIPSLWGRWRRWLRLPSAGQEPRRRARMVWANPIAWREANACGHRFRGLASVLGRWGFVAVSVALAAGLIYLYHTGRPNPLTGAAMTAADLRALVLVLLLAQLMVVTLVAVYVSAGAISREREDGTLDLLLTTPITPRQYIWGKLRGLVSFLTLLLTAPILTLGCLSLYVFLGLLWQWPRAHASVIVHNAGLTFPLLPPEVALLLPLIVAPFIALCVAVGLWWSLKSRSVLGAVTPTVGVVGVVLLFLGFCGYNAAENIPLLGPVLNALSPLTSLSMLLNPWERVQGFAEAPVLGRVMLAVAAAVAGGVYSLIVYTLLQAMIRGFDYTVRRLSGAEN